MCHTSVSVDGKTDGGHSQEMIKRLTAGVHKGSSPALIIWSQTGRLCVSLVM